MKPTTPGQENKAGVHELVKVPKQASPVMKRAGARRAAPKEDADRPVSSKDQYARWMVEFDAAKRELERWWSEARAIDKQYRAEEERKTKGQAHWHFYSANVNTLKAIMFGQTPKVDVSRRFADFEDDVARVGGEVMERNLNQDVDNKGDGYAASLRHSLSDFLIAGMGVDRVRYEATFEDVPGQPASVSPEGVPLPAVPPSKRKSYECVEVDYIHWEDFLFSPCRVWSQARWVRFTTFMSKDEATERFPDFAEELPYEAKGDRQGADDKDKPPSPWGRAEVWEVWDKERMEVVWMAKGYPGILDTKPDTYGLKGFFPCPEPLVANASTTKFVPVPDYKLAKDIYGSLDNLCTRINLLIKALRVVGLYDKNQPALARMFAETSPNGNEMIAVDQWAALAESGGIKGAVDWFPLEQVAATLDKLREQRAELQDALYQITGLSDIVRGQASSDATATEQSIKAKFASVRLQFLQDEFARFASDLQRLRAELMSAHFDPETLARNSNLENTPDAEYLPPAIELIKSNVWAYRIEVKPESVSLTDFAALQQERLEVLNGIGTFFKAAMPLAQIAPSMGPVMLKLLQVTLAGTKGGAAYEPILDKAVKDMEAALQQPQGEQGPDPRVQAQQMKGEQDMQKVQMQLQADLALNEAEVAGDERRQMSQAQWNLVEQQAANDNASVAANDDHERAVALARVNAVTKSK